MTREQVFTLEATPLKYGRGAAAEAGWDLERLGVRRIVTSTQFERIAPVWIDQATDYRYFSVRSSV